MQPFYLETSDNERLFCWHVVPLDVYLQNEEQLAMGTTTGEILDELKGTMGEKLLRADPESRVVVNFHGVSLPVCVMSSAIWQRFPGPLPMSTSIFRTIVPCPELGTCSNATIERRPSRPGLATFNVSLNLRHPPHSPPDLRLPRLRTFHTQQRASHSYGNRSDQ